MSAVAVSVVGSVIAKEITDKLFPVKQDIEEIKKTVETSSKPITFSKTLIEGETTTNQSFKKTPIIEIENPLKEDLKIESVSFVPDASFKAKGVLKIQSSDGNFSVESKNPGDFSDVVDVIVKYLNGLLFERNKSIKIHFWNGTDGVAVKLTVMVTFGRIE